MKRNLGGSSGQTNMKKNKTKEKLMCAHCFHEFPVSKHKAFKESHWCGDGDGPDDQEHYHSYDFEPTIVDSCPKCGEDVHVTMFIPEYVQAEPFPYFDIDTFLYARDALSEYKKKWYKLLDDGDYGLECDKSDLFLKIIRAKSIKEAKLGTKRKYHKFVEFVYNLKVKSILEEDDEDKEEEVDAQETSTPEWVNNTPKKQSKIFIPGIGLYLLFLFLFGKGFIDGHRQENIPLLVVSSICLVTLAVVAVKWLMKWKKN